MQLSPGDRLGPYQIGALLGAGGMGEVYKARDTRLDRAVAIKVLPRHVTAEPGSRERFEREARTISQLGHPRICTLHDIGNENGVEYLVLEYVEGETLADRLKRGPLPLPEALAIAGEIADALDAAHRHQIVHRDLKPGNVMLTKSGTKLLDFGLAKSISEVGGTGASAAATMPVQLTLEGTVVGTLPYMAPEQLKGGETDQRSDVFAFGATLYEMIAGRRAFQGQGAALIGAILERDPAPLSSIQPAVPDMLDRVVRRCLEKDPERRWQSVADLATALRWSCEPARAGAGGSEARSRRAAAAMMLLASGMLVIGAVGGLWMGRRGAPAPADPAPIRFVVDDPPVAATIAGGVSTLAVARDGSLFVYVAIVDGVRWLYLRRLGDAVATRIAGTDGANTPFLSPDARWVGFTKSSTTASRLQKVSLNGGEPVTITELGATRGAAWATDGTIVFAPNPEFGLWRVSADGGTPVPITRPDASNGARSHRWPFLLPDGRSVLYTIARADMTTFDDAVIAIGDLQTGEETELVRGGSYPSFVPATGHLLYARAGTLLAVPLDVERRATRGPSVTVLTNIVTYPATGGAAVATSETGVLLSLSGKAPSARAGAIVQLDRHGVATTLPFPAEGLGPLSLAPDGRTIALDVDGANSSIWIGDLQQRSLVRLTPTWTNIWPTWAPDSRRLAYASGRGNGHRVWVQGIDGRSQPEQVTGGVNRHSVPTSWSSDGRYIAYDDQVPPARRDVMVVDLFDQRRTFALAQTPFDEHSAAFSPDMRYVAYVSNESGTAEVYLQTFPAPTARTRISRAGGLQPVWAHSGRELYFVNGDAVTAVEIATAPALAIGEPKVLFRRPMPATYAVTPEGRFLVFEEPQTPLGAGRLEVTVNWLSLLGRTN
jgi:serine/threonine-protein kinase